MQALASENESGSAPTQQPVVPLPGTLPSAWSHMPSSPLDSQDSELSKAETFANLSLHEQSSASLSDNSHQRRSSVEQPDINDEGNDMLGGPSGSPGQAVSERSPQLQSRSTTTDKLPQRVDIPIMEHTTSSTGSSQPAEEHDEQPSETMTRSIDLESTQSVSSLERRFDPASPSAHDGP